MDTAISSVSPTTGLAPRRDLQIRPPICLPPPTNTPDPALRSMPPTHAAPQQSKRRPLPPPKPQRPDEFEQPQYIEPGLDSKNEVKDSMYFILSPTGESVLQDGLQGVYEEMDCDTDELNRNPPPVWKPYPQPQHKSSSTSSSSSIIYSRVERGKILDHTETVSASALAHKSRYSTNPGVSVPCKPVQKPSVGLREDARWKATKPHPLPKQRQFGAPPPTRPKPPSSKDQNQMEKVLSDLSLVGKLHEKRQELYGAVDTSRASVSSFDPMENYEEVSFDLVDTADSSDDDNEVSQVFNRATNMTLPPRRHNIGSEVAMMQCPPQEKKAQEYLSFQPSQSPSPRESWCEPSNGDSISSLSPQLPRESLCNTEYQPELPPRERERMRGSPQFVRKPLPPTAHRHSTPVAPPEPPARSRPALHREKSASEEDMHGSLHAKPLGQQPRPASSSFDAPPPVPFRNTLSKDVSLAPQPLSGRDIHVPVPLPAEARSSQLKPPLRRHRQLPCVRQVSSGDETPPPVPIRQSSSGQATQSWGDIEPLLQPPRTSSICASDDDDDAPPVPSRGARQRDVHVHTTHTTPSQQWPQSKPGSTTEIQAKARPPIRPTHVGGVNLQPPAPAWDGVSKRPELKAPIVRPRPSGISKPKAPPVSTKPSCSTKPPVSTKPVSTKPPVSSKPQPSAKLPVSARTDKKLPLPTSRKPVYIPGAVSTGQQNGGIPPPLPPR